MNAVAEEPAGDPSESVVRILALGDAGRQYFGSGVVIAHQTVATNCHVIRKARRVRISSDGAVLLATAQKVAADRDLCILTVPGLQAPVAKIGATRTLAPGDAVRAIGFPVGRPGRTQGEVVGLFELHDGFTVQSTAYFSHGASGGGLFDDTGALVGILTFFRIAEGQAPAYFAIPVEWIEFVRALASEEIAPIDAGIPFWATRIDEQPIFLRAAALELAGRWDEMLEVARSWTRDEPFDPNAWRALAKAAELNGDRAAADMAFKRARVLDLTAH